MNSSDRQSPSKGESREQQSVEEMQIAVRVLKLIADFVKYLLTGPALLASGVAIAALGYFLDFSPLVILGGLLIVAGLGAIFVW